MKILLCIILFVFISCDSRITIISSYRSNGGCIYTLSNNKTFSDRDCRYCIGQEVEPYWRSRIRK